MRTTNIGASLARIRRECLAADRKHGRLNDRRNEAADWVEIIDKQRNDLDLALKSGGATAIQKELTQLAAAITMALATMEIE